MRPEDKKNFLFNFIKNKLSQNVDIEDGNLGLGKSLFYNKEKQESEDNEDSIFVELYCEIPINKESRTNIPLISDCFGQNIEDTINDIREVVKDNIEKLVYSIYNKQVKEKLSNNFKLRMQDIELDIGIEENLFIVQINLIAQAEVVNNNE